ncbi:MAG: hypothetical protein QM578_23335 [Pantoea sp.]|uniref:hypothetical protein n=1 Tax=Pantoea sp. TaxID=69393 RepID=UPI0039E54C07
MKVFELFNREEETFFATGKVIFAEKVIVKTSLNSFIIRYKVDILLGEEVESFLFYPDDKIKSLIGSHIQILISYRENQLGNLLHIFS